MSWTQPCQVSLLQKRSKNFNAETGYEQMIAEYKEWLKHVLR